MKLGGVGPHLSLWKDNHLRLKNMRISVILYSPRPSSVYLDLLGKSVNVKHNPLNVNHLIRAKIFKTTKVIDN